ncbi:MAG: response regulator transcription factor [Pseudomonadota bacterium]
MDIEKTQVIVVDSHPIVREGLRQFLESDGFCSVVAEAGDGESALYACENHQHSVLLTNATLPGSDIFEVIRRAKKSNPETKVIICYVSEDLSVLSEFNKCGTDGFIGQLASSEEYSAAVKTVLADATFFSKNLTEIIFRIKKDNIDQSNAYGLTGRELDILALLSNGLCNKEIANQYDLSVRTVETHRLNIRRKTSSNTLSDLVRIARSLGISHMGSASSQTMIQPGSSQNTV